LPPFQEAARSDVEVTDPVQTPIICEPPQDGFWPTECWSAFVTYTEISEDNYEIAQLNADSLRDSESAYDFILAAGQKQQEMALIREETLAIERREAFLSNLYHRAIILLGVLAAIW